MLTFIVRRLLFALPVLLGVVFVVMLTIDLLPGDAVTLMLGEHATKDAVAALREHLGLDKPFAVRYVDYVARLARGDLGRSIQQNRPVAAELADAWPATLQLAIAALVIAAAVGVAAGVVSAVWPNSVFDALAPEITWNDLNDSLAPDGVVRTEWALALSAASVPSDALPRNVYKALVEGAATGQWPDGMVPHIVFHKPDPGYFPGPERWGAHHTPMTFGTNFSAGGSDGAVAYRTLSFD